MNLVTESEVQYVLRYINEFIEMKEYAPTIREIIPETPFSSPSTIKGILDKLERRGWITRPRQNQKVIQRLTKITEAGREYL